jgi:hypothetical protein
VLRVLRAAKSSATSVVVSCFVSDERSRVSPHDRFEVRVLHVH